MKTMILLMSFFAGIAHAAPVTGRLAGSFSGTCQAEAEGLLKSGRAYTYPAQFVSAGEKFEIYHVRTLLDGGEALEELVVSKQGCKWIAQETVWSE